MDGIHDLGGMHGFGKVEREENEPPFHAGWEAIVVAMFLEIWGRGLINIDEFRHAIERMDPAEYLTSSTWERWLDATVRLLTEKGIIERADIEARTVISKGHPDAPPPASPSSEKVTLPKNPAPVTSFRESKSSPRFTVGDSVLTKIDHRVGHTRLPRYARGRRGVVAAQRGVHVFPDTNAHGLGEQPEHLYSVRFTAAELWGPAAEPNQVVHIDLWESYLRST
jgi:nitrile hydratase subunit beta